MEQKHLDWLITLPESFRYKFLTTAGSNLGYTHTLETLAKMSEAHSGANNPMYGRTGPNHPNFGKVPASAFQPGANNPMYGKVPANAFESGANTGANNPMYGKVAANAMTINVYDIDNVLVHSFSSQVAAAEWLGVSNFTVHNYVKSGKVFKNLYRFTKSGSK